MDAQAGEGNTRWTRLKDLFAEAIDLAPDARHDLLERACAGDAPLRAELEALIEAHHRAGTFLERAALDSPEAARVVLDATGLLAGSDSRPSRFGAYRILRELGRGGMGVVYLAARDDEVFEKLVAIKVVAGDLDHIPRSCSAFMRSAASSPRWIIRTSHTSSMPAPRRPECPTSSWSMSKAIRSTWYCATRRLPGRERLRLFCAVAEAVQDRTSTW